MQQHSPLNHIIKVASRCNLNCSYCYVYNQADTTWRDRPSVMSRETFAIGPIRARYGPTPCAGYLIPIFDDWWFESSLEVWIRELWNIARVVMGGTSRLEMIGNPPLRLVCIETDGSIQGLDKLRSCEDGLSTMPLNVHDCDFNEIAARSPFHAEVMDGLPIDGLALPSGCRGCRERETCAGGHLPNRYSSARGFDNPSVWCADMLNLFAHVRERMGVSHDETRRRRVELARLRAPGPAAELDPQPS